jgi:DNA-binding GntR family transcriptional regulator
MPFLPPGVKVLFAERVDRIRAGKVARDETAIPSPFANRLSRADLAAVDFVARWRKGGRFTIACLHQRVSAGTASTRDFKLLGATLRSPLLRTVEIYQCPEGRVLGVFRSHYVPNYIELQTSLKWPAQS